jgi:hypothetical protein
MCNGCLLRAFQGTHRNFPAMTRNRLLFAFLFLPFAAEAQASPGVAVIERMRRAYEGKWYNTLTFVQRTIIERPGQKSDTTTWYESVMGTKLRIDVGDPSLGNGMLYSPDSTLVMRGGALVRSVGSGNPFLPLIMGVYLKPAEQTAREIAAFGVDVSKATTGTWEGGPVTIVGSASPDDTKSAQFWVDDRNLVVRVLGTLRGMGDADVRIGGYERVGNAWLGTRVSIIQNGRTQVEEYSDWKAGIALSPDLFDPSKWTSAPHWAPKKP